MKKNQYIFTSMFIFTYSILESGKHTLKDMGINKRNAVVQLNRH